MLPADPRVRPVLYELSLSLPDAAFERPAAGSTAGVTFNGVVTTTFNVTVRLGVRVKRKRVRRTAVVLGRQVAEGCAGDNRRHKGRWPHMRV